MHNSARLLLLVAWCIGGAVDSHAMQCPPEWIIKSIAEASAREASKKRGGVVRDLLSDDAINYFIRERNAGYSLADTAQACVYKIERKRDSWTGRGCYQRIDFTWRLAMWEGVRDAGGLYRALCGMMTHGILCGAYGEADLAVCWKVQQRARKWVIYACDICLDGDKRYVNVRGDEIPLCVFDRGMQRQFYRETAKITREIDMAADQVLQALYLIGSLGKKIMPVSDIQPACIKMDASGDRALRASSPAHSLSRGVVAALPGAQKLSCSDHDKRDAQKDAE